MSGQPSGEEAAELLREQRVLCSTSCGRLVEVAYWCEAGQGCFCSWSCLLHWPANVSLFTHDGVYAYWHDGRWLTNGWTGWQGNDNLAEFDHVTEDVSHLAAEALLVELETRGWRVRTPEDQERRMNTIRAQRPDGRGPGEGSWWWLKAVVLLDPPVGVIATTSYGSTPR